MQVEVQLTCLLRTKFLCSAAHLVQGDEPLHDLAFVGEIAVSHLVDGLDNLDEDGMQGVLAEHVHADGVEECDEVLRRGHQVLCRWGGGGGGGRSGRGGGSRQSGCGIRVMDSTGDGGGRETDSQALRGFGRFELCIIS